PESPGRRSILKIAKPFAQGGWRRPFQNRHHHLVRKNGGPGERCESPVNAVHACRVYSSVSDSVNAPSARPWRRSPESACRAGLRLVGRIGRALYCSGRSEEHTSELQSRFDLV